MTEKISIRHMVNMKHLCHFRGTRPPPVMAVAADPGQVKVLTYSHGEFSVPWSETLTVHDVCTEAAKVVCIPRLTSQLFALYDAQQKKWLCPAARIDRMDGADQPQRAVLEYRIRFHTPTTCPVGDSSGFLMLEEGVVNYMFKQYRHKFVNDEIPGLSTEESLGLIVLDFMQHVKEVEIPLGNLNGRLRFGRFLPKSLSDGLTWWDKRKLRRKVRTALTDFRDDPREAFAFKVMFLVSLSEEMKQNWGTERFVLQNSDVFEVSGIGGVQKLKNTYGEGDNVQDSFQFSDILDVSIISTNPSNPGAGRSSIQINRRSTPPMFLEMKSQDDAISFACLLDGYYRLLVDYYHYLNEEIAPPLLVKLIKNKCHGPIPLSKAKKKIDETSQQDGTYLIRQNPEDHGSYCLTVRIDRGLKNFKIIQYEDGHVGLENQPRFSSLRPFVEYYRSRENSWCLEGQLRKAVPIEPNDPSLLLVLPSNRDELPPQPEVGPRIEWIREELLSTRDQWRPVGKGDFTEVCVAEYRKRTVVDNRRRVMRRVMVAIKRPQPSAPQVVQQKFGQSVDLMSSWQHRFIIKFEGIGAGYMLVMEYAAHGALDVYLRYLASHERRAVTITSQLTAAFQIIDALEYLESRRIVHGNISAHNVLVTRPASKLVVKLADPMLSVYYHSLDNTNPSKLSRVRWTAPELLMTNSEPTLAGDKFSYGITLWQIMSHGAKPAENLADDVVRHVYRQGERLDKPLNCPDKVLQIIEACWSHRPKHRPPCKRILRDVNSIRQDLSEGAYLMVLDDDEGVERIPEEEEEEEVEKIPEEGEEDEQMEEQNDDNERIDAIGARASANPLVPHPPNNILERIAETLNPHFGLLDTLDMEEETKFIGVDKIPDGSLTRQERLGSGHYGVVFRGKLKKSKPGFPEEDVAIKLIKSDRKDRRMEQFQQEIKAMARCDHKNIVKVLGYLEDNTNHLQLVMEYFPLGSLEKYLREKKDKVPHKTLYLFGQQICQGMKYLHEVQRMVHRDLAARNVLVASENEVKITDFGLARIFGEDKDYYRAKETNQTVPIRWYAPEWLRHHKYQKESDVWSFGIVLWEMFSYGGEPLYQDASGRNIEPSKLLDHFENGQRLSPPPSCPQDIYKIMWDCWKMAPKDRPKFEELVHRLGSLVQQEEM